MHTFKKCTENYVNWVIRLGKIRSALLGFFILAFSALLIQIGLDYLFFGEINRKDILLSICFGLISAPLVIYFFNVIVEKLEHARLSLEKSVLKLGKLREQDFLLTKQLEKNAKDKTTLMATLSHELRTPLNGIIGLSRMLLETPLNEQQQSYLKTINSSAMSLGHIFSDIIDLEKIDSRRIELFKQPLHFGEFIHDICHFAELMCDKKRQPFQLETAGDFPAYLLADQARLSQILWNLIHNACKFTPEGGEISLKICRLSPNRYQFSVQDSGIGIPKAEQNAVFELFYQSPQRQKAQGSGIGLAVAKQLALLMNGDLWVESDGKTGSTFFLEMEAEPARAERPLAIPNYALRVLLVEDVAVNVTVAKALLEKFGCEVVVAETGQAALARFAETDFDLVLLDIQLPDMTGIEIAQRWRTAYEQDELDYLPPLIALTANIMQTKADYQQQGMDDVLRKPLTLEALAHTLADHFGDVASEKPMPKAKMENNGAVDNAFLADLTQVMGTSSVQANLALFAELMPSYQAELEQALQAWQASPNLDNKKTLAEQAHKLKGAFAAIGLVRLQQVAELAQTPEHPDWQAQIANWCEALKDWQADWQTAVKLIE